jgi:class 3 adenylate cyclase/dienelactone hydrolase
MSQTRRLTAILAADVAGYSRLMGADEEGTHERVQAYFRQLLNPKINEHRGRIVKNTGDGFLAEFQSVVDAVRCAVEIQRGMAEREPEVPEERRIRFRIGINLGDVIVEEHDIFGDGVNVAARLEALAEPGGICVSRMVHDQVQGKLAYAFEDLGEQSVKNIARPVRVYRVRDSIAAEKPAPPSPRPLAFPEKPSIAVLPFHNMSGDPEQEYFADGMVEEIITALSRIRWLFVIARNSSFTYRGQAVDVKQVGRELGVCYLRDRGEPSLIAGITRQIMCELAVDPTRVYIAGLSAGGAAAAIMGSAYPDLYAAICVHSGLACGAAKDLASAFAAMRHGRSPLPEGARHPLPTIVFHGDRDKTVNPLNGDQVIAQSKAGIELYPTITSGQSAGGISYTRAIQADGSGRPILEQWVLHGAGHAWSGGSPAGSYTDPRGPDASREMLRFFHERSKASL